MDSCLSHLTHAQSKNTTTDALADLSVCVKNTNSDAQGDAVRRGQRNGVGGARGSEGGDGDGSMATARAGGREEEAHWIYGNDRRLQSADVSWLLSPWS